MTKDKGSAAQDVSGLGEDWKPYKRICAKGHITAAYGSFTGTVSHYFCPACLALAYGTIELVETP